MDGKIARKSLRDNVRILLVTCLLIGAFYFAYLVSFSYLSGEKELSQQSPSYPIFRQIAARQEENEAFDESQQESEDFAKSLLETPSASVLASKPSGINYNYTKFSYNNRTNGSAITSASRAILTPSWFNVSSASVTAETTLPIVTPAGQFDQAPAEDTEDTEDTEATEDTETSSMNQSANLTNHTQPSSLEAVFKNNVDENGKPMFDMEHYQKIQEEISKLNPDWILPPGKTGDCKPLPDDPCINATAALADPRIQSMLASADESLNKAENEASSQNGNATVINDKDDDDKHLGAILGTTLGVGIPASTVLWFSFAKLPRWLYILRYWIERVNLMRQAAFIRRVGQFWRESFSDLSDFSFWSDLPDTPPETRPSRMLEAPPDAPPAEAPPPGRLLEAPSAEAPPAELPPAGTPPLETPPAAAPPAEVPPAGIPPGEEPPGGVPPVEAPPVEAPPVVAPPVEPLPPVVPPAAAPPVAAPPVGAPPVVPPPVAPGALPVPAVPGSPDSLPVPGLPGSPGSLAGLIPTPEFPSLPDLPSLSLPKPKLPGLHVPDFIPDGLFHNSHDKTNDDNGHRDKDENDNGDNDDGKNDTKDPAKDLDYAPKLHAAEAQILQLRNELRRAQKEVEEAHEQRRQSRRELRDSMEELDQTWKQILDDTTTEKSELEEQLDEHASELATTIGELHKAEEKVQERTGEVGKLKAERERLERQYALASRTVTSLQIEKLDLKRQIEIEGENSAELKTKLKSMEDIIAKSREVMSGITKSMNDVMRNYGALTKELETLRDEHCKKTDALDQSEKHQSQLVEELVKARQQNEKLKKQVQSETDEKEKCTEELQTLKSHECPKPSISTADSLEPKKEIQDLRKQRDQLQSELQECAKGLDNTRNLIPSNSGSTTLQGQDKDCQTALVNSIRKEILCRSEKHRAAAQHSAQLKYKDLIIQNREFRIQQCEAQRDRRPGPTGAPPGVPDHMPEGPPPVFKPGNFGFDGAADFQVPELDVLERQLKVCQRDLKVEHADGMQCWRQCHCPLGIRPGMDHLKRSAVVVV